MRRSVDITINVILVIVLICVSIRVLVGELTQEAKRGLTSLVNLNRPTVNDNTTNDEIDELTKDEN